MTRDVTPELTGLAETIPPGRWSERLATAANRFARRGNLVIDCSGPGTTVADLDQITARIRAHLLHCAQQARVLEHSGLLNAGDLDQVDEVLGADLRELVESIEAVPRG